MDTNRIMNAALQAGWNLSQAKYDFGLLQRFLHCYENNKAEAKADPEAWREEYRKKQAAGVKFEKIGQGGLVWLPYVGGFENGIKEDYREVPQEVQKEGDMRIPEASEIRKWADRYYSLWCFVENSLPRDASSDTFDIFRGYARQVNDEIYGVTDKAKEPHAAERALWKAQRDAGTNEVWQVVHETYLNVAPWGDIPLDMEPHWYVGYLYRPKPKTVKYYFALLKDNHLPPFTHIAKSLEQMQRFVGTGIGVSRTIIGDIEEREIEA